MTREELLSFMARGRAKHAKAWRRLGLSVPEMPAEEANAARASVRRAVAERDLERRAAQAASDDRVLRVAEVMKLTGLGRTTLWQLERDGLFPKRAKLVGRAVGWRASEVARWISECYAEPHAECGQPERSR